VGRHSAEALEEQVKRCQQILEHLRRTGKAMAQPYALAVQVNGQTVGYVANEEVFNLAKEDVMQRINYAGSDKTELTIPAYTGAGCTLPSGAAGSGCA